MDKTVLIEYADVQEEVKDLRRRIRKLEDEIVKLENSVVSDTVSCGKKGKKPIKTVRITGTPDAAITRKRTSLRARRAILREKEAELLEQQTQAEGFINGIEKSELRTMLKLRYMDGLMWHQVAYQMSLMYPRKNYTADSCRMVHNRFFEKL
ncbi:MAG: hypothetical protein LIO86_09785 [Lachnospiraceae bacterium]|nr:hypothetical protein [Lachnospiraceae bacterium]